MTPAALIDPALAEMPVSPTERQLDHLLHTVGIAPLEDTGWIRVTGSDRVRWLNGMVTNSIQQLQPGEGVYSFALNAQGQIQGDLTTFATEDALLIETSRGQLPTLLALFDRFIIMDDVELHDISPDRSGLLLVGPLALNLLNKINLPVNAPKPPVFIDRISWQQHQVEIVSAHAPLVPRFELWADPATLNALKSELVHAAEALNGSSVSPEALEHLRLIEATPRFGTDITAKHLAQETAQDRALHFAKGCYLGQEIVERIRSRGNVHRTIAAFRLEGPLPSPGTPLAAESKPIGELTSISTLGPSTLALGTIRREALDRPTPIAYTTPSGPGTAIPTHR